MREIEFEAWDIENQVMIPWSLDMFNETSPVTEYGGEFPQDEEHFILRQYTGQLDFNNKKAFDGDIVKILGHKSRKYTCEFPALCKIIWSDESSGWLLQSLDGKHSFGLYKNTIFQIVGNIYESHLRK